MAAAQYFKEINPVPMKSLQQVFENAEAGNVSYGVVPVENSIEGSVNETFDLLLAAKINVSGEIYQRIRHCLIANEGTSKDDIRQVYSHPQALAQCRNYIQSLNAEPIATYDTAGSVKYIKEKKIADAAAIASKIAGQIYEMKILDEGIEDRKNNYTRFFVISNNSTSPTGNDRTSIIFSVKHVPGALVGILSQFAKRNINLTKIESRPTKQTPWEYNFYVDFEGHTGDDKVSKTISELADKTSFLKILGSYKKADFH